MRKGEGGWGKGSRKEGGGSGGEEERGESFKISAFSMIYHPQTTGLN